MTRISPSPGDWAVGKINGPGGLAIGVAEAVAGRRGFREWEHALVYLGGGMILQAEPGGAEIVPMPDLPGYLWSTGRIPLTGAQRDRVPELAERYRGIGYSALDYVAIAAHHAHLPDLPVWPEPVPGDHLDPGATARGAHHLVTLRAFISSGGHMQCAQLVDDFALRLGVHLFTDHRWPGYVMPADLGYRLTEGES